MDHMLDPMAMAPAAIFNLKDTPKEGPLPRGTIKSPVYDPMIATEIDKSTSMASYETTIYVREISLPIFYVRRISDTRPRAQHVNISCLTGKIYQAPYLS
jgi:hypothetical protein